MQDFSFLIKDRTQAVAAMMTILTTRLVGAPEAGIFSVLILQMHHVSPESLNSLPKTMLNYVPLQIHM